MGPRNIKHYCATCKGTGSINTSCSSCQNTRVEIEKVKNLFFVPPSTKNNQVLTYEGFGNFNPKTKKYGDLFITIKVVHGKKSFKPKEFTVKISVSKAVLGGVAEVQSDFGLVQFDIPEGTKDGDVVQAMNEYDLQGRVEIVIPTNISEEEKLLYEELEKFN